MPWTAISGNEYQLCLLDTNAISEIVKNRSVEGAGFIRNFPPSSHAPCITVYNIIELRRNKRAYNEFLKMFSIYPLVLTKPQELILDEEIRVFDTDERANILFNAFTPRGEDDSYNLSKFIDRLFQESTLKTLEINWRSFEESTLSTWVAGRDNFITSSEYPNAADAERYIDLAFLQTLIRLRIDWCKAKIEARIEVTPDDFPSLKTMLYSLYYRIYDPSWQPSHSDVTDILISSAIPYSDVFITEKFQANILSKLKTQNPKLKSIDVKRIKDIR